MSDHQQAAGRGTAAPDPVLVPVSPSATLRETVEYVVESTLEGLDAAEGAEGTAGTDQPVTPGTSSARSEADAGEETAPAPTIYFVYVHAPEEFDPEEHAPALEDADELLERVRIWAEEDAGGEEFVDVRTRHVGRDRYLFSPADVAAALIDAARPRGVTRIVLDPEYDPGVGTPLLQPLAYELGRDDSIAVEEAPVRQSVRRTPLVGRSSARRIGALAAVSFLFYQVLAGGFSAFDLVTGAITAIVVAGSLSRISFGRDPSLRQTPIRIARGVVYVPYLLWQIVVANVIVAAVILNPVQDIDPQMTRIRPAVYGALPVTSLANSITLTPGTLTVRVEGRDLLVHTLIPTAREDLFDGGLERAIRFVFYGRRSMRVDSLADRGLTAIVPPGGNGTIDPEASEAGDIDQVADETSGGEPQ